MSQQTEPSSSRSLLQVSEGPYESIPIIENIPKEYVYTCIQYYDNHIYLGTDAGTLLHYFEIETGNYMLVSELNFSDIKQSRIDKIELLLKNDRALVLSEGKLKLFLLPEFAPAPHIATIPNVNDFSIFDYCRKDKQYLAYIYSKNTVKVVSITAKEMKVVNKYEIKSIDKALVTKDDTKLVAAVENCYSLVNLTTQSVSPFFKVSEENGANLPPVMAKFSENEFLVTCGMTIDQDSMGLILNGSGEITQGTVAMEHYPESIVVDYPYIISQFNGSAGCSIYMMKENEEPHVIQKISYGDKTLRVGKVNTNLKIRNSFHKDLVEKLRYVALVGNLKFREDQEKSYVERSIEEFSNLLLFGSFGIFILRRIPFLLKIKSYGEETLPLLEDYLNNGAYSNVSESLETSYIRILYVLLKLFHAELIDTKIIDLWLNYAQDVDIRLLVYLLAFNVFGALWIPNGLLNFVKQLRSLNMVHKCFDLSQMIQYLKRRIKDQYSSVIKDLSNVLLSLDMILLNCCIKNDTIDLKLFDETSLSEIVIELEKRGNKFSEELLDLYELEGNWSGILRILRQSYPERLVSFVEENYTKLSAEYLKNELVQDVCLACNKDIEHSLSGILYLIEKFEINATTLLSNIEKTSDKILILEHLGPTSLKDQEFILEYYGNMLKVCYKNLESSFSTVIEEYSSNCYYKKPKLKEYFKIKLGTNEDFKKFLNSGQKLYALIPKSHETILKKIDQIDSSFLLRAFLLSTDDFIMGFDRSKVLDLLTTWNDFLTFEDYLKHYPNEVLTVFDHYLSINDISVLHTFLLRNVIVLNNQALFVQILERIPGTAELFVMADVLLPITRKAIQERVSLKIEKEIIKDKLQTFSNILLRTEDEN